MAVAKLVEMVLLFLTAFAILELCVGFEYSDLKTLNATCSPKDTCEIRGKGPRLDDPYDWKSRNCFCDNLCADYGDCCLDADAYNLEEQVKNTDNYECITLVQWGSLYMKGRCLPEWDGHDVADLCNSVAEDSDPMAKMPVTSLESYVTYKNYYCAICNNDSSAFEIWKPRLECPTLKVYQKLYENLTVEYVTSNLVYNGKNWGLNIEGEEGEEFHMCYIYPSMPPTVPHMVRRCKDTIKRCPASWQDEEVRQLCHSYTAVRYKFDQPYRNIHCAMCNGFTLAETNCISQLFVRFLNFGNDFNNQTFAMLLDFSDRSGSNIVGSTSTCKLGEVFDPFFKKCRNVICGKRNQEYRFGRCIDMDIPSLGSKESTTTTSTEGSVTPNTSSSESPVTNTTKKLSSLIDGTDGVIQIVGNNSSKIIGNVDTSEVASNETSEITYNEAESNAGNLTSTNVLSVNSSANNSAPVHSLPCEKFLLPMDEYSVSENGTIVVEKYNRVYEISEYEHTEGGILVCIIQTRTEKFSRIMSWVTLGGLGLSCLCLILHLIAFLVVPELRNLSGKNLASLCLVLLGAFSTFILSIFGEPGKQECFILASFMYYFFLSSFCWVNVMAFDVWRTLSLATTELRVSAGGQWCKFLIYTIYGWLLPAAAVIGVVILDIVRPDFVAEKYYPALGEYWCWFGHRKALLVFFAAPLMAIMILNIILFILSARIIANTMESTAKMTSCAPYQSQFKLYMRLALLMGLTWISGIVAGYLQLEPIWYVFILMNTLQGFFIFLAFTCTRKVWHAFRCGCCGRTGRCDSSWALRSPSSSKQGLQSTHSNISNLSQTTQSTSQLTSNAQSPANEYVSLPKSN